MNWGTSGVEKHGNRNRLDRKRFSETEGDKGGWTRWASWVEKRRVGRGGDRFDEIGLGGGEEGLGGCQV